MNRTVDQVMNSMADPEFDKFTSGVLADVSTKLGRDDIALLVQRKQREKDRKAETTPTPETESTESAHEEKHEEKPIPA